MRRHGQSSVRLLSRVLVPVLAGLLAASAAPAGRAAAPTTPPVSRPAVTKLLVFVEENHSLEELKEGLPYAFSLAKQYGYATSYDAVTHPSLPNYLAMAGGSTFGVGDDADPSSHPLRGRSVFGQALAAGRTAALYAQSMPGTCTTTPADPYAVKHNPWAYFVDERSQCAAHDFPMRQFGKDAADGTLPNVGMVIPDLDHDAHDGTLAAADAWFESVMKIVFAGKDWKSGHLAVVLTADEDDRAHGNRVLTIVIHPSQHHHVVTTPLDHYSLEGLYADVAGLAPLRHARTAPSMAAAFGLPLAP